MGLDTSASEEIQKWYHPIYKRTSIDHATKILYCEKTNRAIDYNDTMRCVKRQKTRRQHGMYVVRHEEVSSRVGSESKISY